MALVALEAQKVSDNYNDDLCEGEIKTGRIVSIIVPRDRRWRKIWAFYQVKTADLMAGSKCDLVFYLVGKEIERFPAFRKTAAGSIYGIVTSIQSQNNLPTWPENSTPGNSRTPFPFSMSFLGDWFTNGSDNTALITPFDIPIECDLIELVTNNPATATWALLGCVSLDLPRQ